MTEILWFIVSVLVVYRIAELIANDTIFEPIRIWTAKEAAITESTGWRYLAVWLSCPFCIGTWVSIPVTIIYVLCAKQSIPILFLWLGIAGGQYFLSALSMRTS